MPTVLAQRAASTAETSRPSGATVARHWPGPPPAVAVVVLPLPRLLLCVEWLCGWMVDATEEEYEAPDEEGGIAVLALV